MLEYLQLKNVGPAPEMEMTLAPRLNLITGDNGLGKSFLLDVAWWALTRKWPHDLNSDLASGYAARPTDVRKPASIAFRLESKTKSVASTSSYVPRDQAWLRKPGRPWNPGLVVYVLADGGFAVWDPARNYWKSAAADESRERLPGYVLAANDVWDGRKVEIEGKLTTVCNGLLSDWPSWIRERGADSQRMAAVLDVLASSSGEGLRGPGSTFARLSVNDVRDIPTIRMSYGQDVPILYASLGIRRITALAYMLAWAWREHLNAASQLGEPPTTRLVLLFDEIEAHLHPRWQRTIVPALLRVVETLTGDSNARIQLIAATHSPMVLASVEPLFDTETDQLFALDLDNGKVALREQPWAKQGDVANWLVSDSFGLRQGRSLEAEKAIEAAKAWMRKDQAALPEGLMSESAIHQELQRVLAGHDPFWPRWVVSAGKRRTLA